MVPPISKTRRTKTCVFLCTWLYIDYLVRWAVIVGSTVVLRSIVTVPLAVHQNKLITTIELSQPTLQLMTEALKQRVVGEGRRMNLSAEEADRKFRKEVSGVHLVSLENGGSKNNSLWIILILMN